MLHTFTLFCNQSVDFLVRFLLILSVVCFVLAGIFGFKGTETHLNWLRKRRGKFTDSWNQSASGN